MKKEELYKLPKWAGIYCIRNNINSKCYIGQAIMLRKRLLYHISNYENSRYDAPIYRAFKKYGLENFSIEVLEEFKGMTKEDLKKTLDEKEKLYIKEFNSYGNTGYNQTLGGDGGILGYKMTNEQKEIIANNSKEIANDGRNMIYCYDIFRNCTYIMITLKALNNVLKENLRTGDIRNLLCRKRYILSRSQQELANKKLLFKNKVNTPIISERFILKITNEMIKDIKEGMKEKEFLKKYDVCKKTYYNYKKQIL